MIDIQVILISASRNMPRKAARRVSRAVLVAPISALAAVPSPDAQIWSEADLVASLTRDTTLVAIAIARAGESVRNPTLTAMGFNLNQNIGHWTLGVGYRHQVLHPASAPQSQLAMAIISYLETWSRSSMEFRVRIDNSLLFTGNPWRFRIRAEYRWATPEAGPISYFFINDEGFYQGSAGEWSRDRAQIGANLSLTRRADLSLYYQWQYDRISAPARINALGLTFQVKVD